jgi:hydroxymethylpyrimidine/phosphomethylpyrimidine kinase
LRNFLALCLFVLSVGASISFAANHRLQDATLVNVTTSDRLIEGTSYTRAILVVKIDDVVYTLQGERVKRKTTDYAKGLIVGDPVIVSVEGKDVFLQRPDGKYLKTAVLKRERAAKPK